MMNLNQAAKAIGGATTAPEVGFARVTTDSRAIEPGDLFIALKGERFDAHDFVTQALADGAAAAMVNTAWEGGAGLPLLRVDDTHRALGQLAAYWRSQFNLPVAAITGSSGKTSVKEMLASICCAASSDAGVLATRGNLNNDIGAPLTLLRLAPEHRYAVIEMGMNHPGEISYLTNLGKPTVALVNNAAAVHLEGLGSVEAVARAKGEIFEGLTSDGVAVINADDAHAPLWRSLAGSHRRIEFGLSQGDVRATFKLAVFDSEVSVHTPAGDVSFKLGVPGLHNVRNALAATAAALAMGIGLDAIGRGLALFDGVKGRLQRKAGLSGAIVVDDTYNANPDSMAAAIAVLAGQKGRRVFVMGDMGELGPDAPALHADIGKLAADKGIEHFYCLGELTREAARAYGPAAHHYSELDALLAALKAEMTADTTVLVKGSRFMKMERVVDFLTAQLKG
ncbi:UDP-N-acetylmuramoyl-tripeptide--D-alanyl-D-alanine ligase [Chitinivorax sp. PXF-14]|uniref:UDP-N-acetylmuramoyl-tripeptide--D-alanyl-D- alanine ligase n=1 Tax=Chitinivorax sp. PXF-14 TaxID=3230488 RepID=UPI0034655EE0